jgi:membrane protease YdiL (CAAX protease family)
MGDAVWGNVASLVLSTLGLATAFAVTGVDEAEDLPLGWSTFAQALLWAGMLAAVVYASYAKGRRSLRVDFALAMRPLDVLVGLVAGLLGQIAISLVTIPIYDLLGIDSDKVGETAERMSELADDPVAVAFLVLVVVVGAPVVEELFYRGLWFRSMERRFDTTAAIIGTSVLFGAIHLQPYDLLPLALFGLLAVLLVARTGRLGPAIWAHVAFNLTAVISLL